MFTAGCPICDPTVELVAELACSDCEVTVHDLRVQGAEKARQYGIKTVPAVVVDGRRPPRSLVPTRCRACYPASGRASMSIWICAECSPGAGWWVR
ncbi:MAG: thioredoxin family protein [Pseudonocardiaceae bacterium]